MKSAIFAVALALAIPAAYAQVPGLPDCAGPCLLGGLSKAGCANPTDFKCVCASTAFVESAATCIQASCPADQIPTAVGAAYEFCLSFGVTIPTTFPGATEAPTTSAPAEVTTSTPAPEVTSTLVEDTTSAEVSTTVSSDKGEITYPVTTFTTFTATVSGTGSVTPTGNSSSPTVVPPPANSEGAAVKNIASFGAVAMAVAGFFAM